VPYMLLPLSFSPSTLFLGFHAGKLVNQYGEEFPATEATRAVATTYPAEIRNWIRRHGGLTRRPIYLRGRELAALYPLCR
jgi:hypothetical protein